MLTRFVRHSKRYSALFEGYRCGVTDCVVRCRARFCWLRSGRRDDGQTVDPRQAPPSPGRTAFYNVNILSYANGWWSDTPIRGARGGFMSQGAWRR